MNYIEELIKENLCIEEYVNMLKEANRYINLISRRDMERIWSYHIRDSLFILPYIEKYRYIMDLGTGGGLPGIPLACVERDKFFFLVESIGKKVKFLLEVKEKLKLKNVEIIHGRVENLKVDVDVVVARTVTSVYNIIKWTRNIRKSGLKYILYKGRGYLGELREAEKIMAKFRINLVKHIKYNVEDVEKHLLILEVE